MHQLGVLQDLHDLFHVNAFIRHDGAHRAAGAQLAGDRAGIDALDAGNVLHLQKLIQRVVRTEVARLLAALAHHEPEYRRVQAFEIIMVDAVIADHRISHHDDLSAIGQVAEHFLIAAHSGIEDQFSYLKMIGAEGRALIHAAIFQNQ